MSRALHRVVGAMAFAAIVAAAGACSSGSPSALSASSATSCDELVKAAAHQTQTIVRDLQGKTEADLRAVNADDPFAPLIEPYAVYKTRATELGCDQGELVRLACDEYQDIKPTGPAAEEFLARMQETCR